MSPTPKWFANPISKWFASSFQILFLPVFDFDYFINIYKFANQNQATENNMDKVKQITKELRTSLPQHVGGRKIFNKLEMEQKLLQRRRQEEQRDAEAKALRKKQLQQQQKNDKSKLLNSKTDSQCSTNRNLLHQPPFRDNRLFAALNF